MNQIPNPVGLGQFDDMHHLGTVRSNLIVVALLLAVACLCREVVLNTNPCVVVEYCSFVLVEVYVIACVIV